MQAIASGLVVLFVKICLALSFLLFLYLYAYEIFLINFIKEKGKEGFFFLTSRIFVNKVQLSMVERERLGFLFLWVGRWVCGFIKVI